MGALTRIEHGAIETQETAHFEATLTGVALAGLTAHTRRAYERALVDFWAWHRAHGRPVLRKATLQRYAADLAAAGASAANINQRLCALRRMVREGANNRRIDEQDARSAAAVEGTSAEGRSVGVWLTKQQAEAFINALPCLTLAGKRDFALVCLFLSSGLRRSEMASLTVGHLHQVEGRWAILGIVGKRNKMRDVPITAWANTAIDAWCTAAGIDAGHIFRPVNKGDNLAGESMTPEAIRQTIDRAIGQANQTGAGLPAIAAHDLRRTYAQLARKGGAPIEQIAKTLGHESIRTTQIYLGNDQDFVNSPCDVLGLSIERAA